MDFQMRVSVDKYLNNKEKYKEMCSDCDMTVRPADMYGRITPMGISAADKTRNIRDVSEDIKYRLGC